MSVFCCSVVFKELFILVGLGTLCFLCFDIGFIGDKVSTMTVSISVASVVSVENVYGMARGVMHTVNSVVSTTVSATVSVSVSTVCDVSYDTGVDCKVVTMMGANDWVFVIVGDSTKNVSDMVSAAVSTTVSYSNCMVATTASALLLGFFLIISLVVGLGRLVLFLVGLLFSCSFILLVCVISLVFIVGLLGIVIFLFLGSVCLLWLLCISGGWVSRGGCCLFFFLFDWGSCCQGNEQSHENEDKKLRHFRL